MNDWQRRLCSVVEEQARTLPFYDKSKGELLMRARGNPLLVLCESIGKHITAEVVLRDLRTQTFFELTLDLTDSVAYITDLNVDYDAQGRGWGRTATECMERIALEMGCNNVRIWQNIQPEFWKHMGYKRTERFAEKKVAV